MGRKLCMIKDKYVAAHTIRVGRGTRDRMLAVTNNPSNLDKPWERLGS